MSGSATSPLPPNNNRAPSILGVFWTFFPFTLATIVLRLYVRIRIRQAGLDDWLMLVAWLCHLASLIPATLVVINGVGRHAVYLSIDQLIYIAYVVPISQVTSLLCNAFTKASIAFLLQRLLGPGDKAIKYVLWVSTIIFAASCIVAALLTYLNCLPPSANWDLKNPHAMDDCLPTIISIAVDCTTGALGSLQDFLLAIIPIAIVWNLKMSIKQKISLAVLLGVGVFGGIATAVKTYYLPELRVSIDRTYILSDPYIWVNIETNLNIICGSIPALKPLYDWITKRRPLNPTRNGYNDRSRSKRSAPHLPSDGPESMERALSFHNELAKIRFDRNGDLHDLLRTSPHHAEQSLTLSTKQDNNLSEEFFVNLTN